MATSVRTTRVTGNRVEIVLSDTDDPLIATVHIQIAVDVPGRDPSWPLGLVEAIALASARNAIGAQIQERTQIHGPISRYVPEN
jgi:hypothetical protein